jgi:hypothetical protein
MRFTKIADPRRKLFARTFSGDAENYSPQKTPKGSVANPAATGKGKCDKG